MTVGQLVGIILTGICVAQHARPAVRHDHPIWRPSESRALATRGAPRACCAGARLPSHGLWRPCRSIVPRVPLPRPSERYRASRSADWGRRPC